jgi:hypothetical protein
LMPDTPGFLLDAGAAKKGAAFEAGEDPTNGHLRPLGNGRYRCIYYHRYYVNFLTVCFASEAVT